MIDGLRLPKSQIATKLYGGIALILAVVYLLAAAATHFASHTEAAVQRFLGGDFGAALIAGNLELALEQQRGLVALSLIARGADSKARADRTFDDLAGRIADLAERLGRRPPDQFATKTADLTQLAAMVLAFVRDERMHEAALMAAEHWDHQTLEDLNQVMIDASICGLGQAAPNPVRCVQKYFPHEVA